MVSGVGKGGGDGKGERGWETGEGMGRVWNWIVILEENGGGRMRGLRRSGKLWNVM